MQKIKYINCCIVAFGKHFKLSPRWSFEYLLEYKGLDFLDKCYEAEHLMSLQDAVADLSVYCRNHGGTLR
ncbi:MAG: DUF3791 domain-containing protein [Bacteroidales bacterium]|nr:DUF3791 domain-containing protein [Bacteroidales bacterium]